jgi:hypothetical protein
MEVSGQLHAPAALSPGNRCIRGCMVLRADLDVMEKRKYLLPLPGMEPRFLSRAAYNSVAVSTQLYIIIHV